MSSLLHIDFVQRRKWPGPGLVVMALALGLTGWQAWQTTESSRLLASEKAGMATLVRNVKKPMRAMSPEERQRHAQLESYARYLAMPWATWLAVLEDHADGKAIVRRVEQDASSETLKVTARAADTGAMMAYVLALQADTRLQGVKLLSHELLRTEPGAPVQFELAAGAGSTVGTEPQSPSNPGGQP